MNWADTVACDWWWRADSQLVMSYWSPSTASFVCLYCYSSAFACSLHLTKCSRQDSPWRHSCSATCACFYRRKDPTRMTKRRVRIKNAKAVCWSDELIPQLLWDFVKPLKHLLYVTLKRQIRVMVQMAHFSSVHKEPDQGLGNCHI